MRRNIKSLIRLIALFLLTVLLTVFIYKTVVHNNWDAPENHESLDHPKQGAFFMGEEKNKLREKIDWHDYALMKSEAARTGVGEHGKKEILKDSDKEKEDRLFKQNGFNAVLSDLISVNRSLPDIRHKDCQKKKYLSELPTVSVVVPFYNEHWSTLLRTAYSVINRSPTELLVEVILVDDHSTKEFLKDQLDNYISAHMPKVKVVRLPEREGLIAARLAGAKAASGDVLIFLDSHTEANVNWLPPLLEPIAENYRYSVCPFIDVVAWDTFEYRAQDEGARGAFDWSFFYKRLPLLPESLANPSEIFESPIMAGGLFAISAKFFWELGGYDEGLDIWGGEQYELSFKIWQCGGKMYDAPCSRVGHIYRGYAPFSNPRKTDYLSRNYKRVAEVWMDEYKEFLYERRSDRYVNVDAGDLTKQRAIREKLQCKPFKWFIENVAYDLVKKYPPVEPTDFANGVIQSVAQQDLCIDSLNHGEKGEVGLFGCSANLIRPQQNQFWALSWHKDIRSKHGSAQCWDVSSGAKNAPILIYGCHGSQGNQLWYYDTENKWLIQGRNKRCLDFDSDTKQVFVNDCVLGNANMQWEWGFVNSTAMMNYKNIGPDYNKR